MLCCLEHIEEGMDRYLDDYGKLPILVEVELPCTCQFCKEAAVYKIIEGVMTDECDDHFGGKN